MTQEAFLYQPTALCPRARPLLSQGPPVVHTGLPRLPGARTGPRVPLLQALRQPLPRGGRPQPPHRAAPSRSTVPLAPPRRPLRARGVSVSFTAPSQSLDTGQTGSRDGQRHQALIPSNGTSVCLNSKHLLSTWNPTHFRGLPSTLHILPKSPRQRRRRPVALFLSLLFPSTSSITTTRQAGSAGVWFTTINREPCPVPGPSGLPDPE